MKNNGSGIGGPRLLIVAVIFILVIGAIFFAISSFFGDSDRQQPSNQPKVTDIFVGRSVRMTVEGPIVANEDRESYRIEVSLANRSIEALQGYDATIAGSKMYSNNRAAYTDFVYALSRAGFGEKRSISDEAADERGACATGRQYTYELLDNGRSLSRLWTTSCSKKSGTLDANSAALKKLFDLQIPDRRDVLDPISLR